MLPILTTFRPLTLIIFATLAGDAIARVRGLDLEKDCHSSCVVNLGNQRLLDGKDLGCEYLIAIQDCLKPCDAEEWLRAMAGVYL